MEEEKRKAIIFDIDGTLAHMAGRIERRGQKAAPFADWDAHDDEVDYFVSTVLSSLSKDFAIVICSGRKDGSRQVLETWLKKNDIRYDDLYMRKQSDNRKDSIIKREIYENEISKKWDIIGVFDDRDQVVAMWRDELNLPCMQVAPGAF